MSNPTAISPDDDVKADLSSYTPGQIDLLASLEAERDRLGLSDSEFCREHLTIAGSSWTRLRSEKYGAGVDKICARLAGNLRNLRIKRASAGQLGGDIVWHPLPPQRLVVDAVSLAQLKPLNDPERLVVFLADTGGGKTALARHLRIAFDGILVDARESWRTSYYAALRDIGTAAGAVSKKLDMGAYSAERALVDRLTTNRRLLIIDEGEAFGPRTINLIKLILNQTPTVVVILAIPELYHRWSQAAWIESQQLIRRCEAIVEAGPVLAEDVAEFLAGDGFQFSGPPELHHAEIAAAANRFGRYSMVRRVRAELCLLVAETIKPADTKRAIAIAEAALRRGKGGA